MRTPYKMKGYSYPGTSPVKDKGNYSEGAQNLLKAVPNKEAYNKLSDVDKKGFDAASKKAGLPTKKSPAKQKDHPARTGVGHLGKGFNIKGYLKGEQGLIPDYKGKSTKKTISQVKSKVKKAANKSTFTNPKGLSEHMSDQMDAKMHTSYLKDINKAKTPKAKKEAESNPMYRHYSEKSKKNRPNKKDRY